MKADYRSKLHNRKAVTNNKDFFNFDDSCEADVRKDEKVCDGAQPNFGGNVNRSTQDSNDQLRNTHNKEYSFNEISEDLKNSEYIESSIKDEVKLSKMYHQMSHV